MAGQLISLFLQKLSSERPSSDGEGAVENGITTVCNGKEQGMSQIQRCLLQRICANMKREGVKCICFFFFFFLIVMLLTYYSMGKISFSIKKQNIEVLIWLFVYAEVQFFKDKSDHYRQLTVAYGNFNFTVGI